MTFRHEWKHPISPGDLLVLRRRLRLMARSDGHGSQGRYLVRSLYFDTPSDRALREKIDGVDRREKFRIRYYDYDTSLIRLEKKSKRNGLGRKVSAPLTAEEAGALAEGRWDWMPASGRDLVLELYSKMKSQGLRPRTIVDYTREAFVYAPGNVRVTLDGFPESGLRHRSGGGRPRHPGGEVGRVSARRHSGRGAAAGPPGRCLLQIRRLPGLRMKRPFAGPLRAVRRQLST